MIIDLSEVNFEYSDSFVDMFSFLDYGLEFGG